MLNKILDANIYKILSQKIGFNKINEIRFRENKPIVLNVDGQVKFFDSNGFVLSYEKGLKASKKMVEDIIYKASEFCHGPLASTSSKTPVILFAIDDKTNPDIKRVITYLKDTKAKTYVITNDKEIAYSSDMAIMINETESIYAFYQAVILMQLLSCEMAFLKGTYQDHVPVLKGRTNTF